MLNNSFQTFFNLKKDLKCHQHPTKSLDRVMIKGEGTRILICSICEYELKKNKIICFTIPLEAFLFQLEEIENKYSEAAELIKVQNKQFREDIVNECFKAEQKVKELLIKIKQNALYEEETIKQLLDKAKHDTKTIIEKMLGDYNTKSCFEGLYSNIQNKFIFDTEEREIINLETYKLALEEAIKQFNQFKSYTDDVKDQLQSLYETLNSSDNSLQTYFAQCECLSSSFLFIDTQSQKESLKMFKPESNEDLNEMLLKLSSLSRGSVSIDLTNNILDQELVRNFVCNFSSLQNLSNLTQIDFSIELKVENNIILNNLTALFSNNEMSFNKINLIINQGKFDAYSLKQCINTAVFQSKQFDLKINYVEIDEKGNSFVKEKLFSNQLLSEKKSNGNKNKESEENESEEQEEMNFQTTNNCTNFQFGGLSLSQEIGLQSRYRKEPNIEQAFKKASNYTKICADNTNILDGLKNTIQESIRSLQGCIEKTKNLNDSMSESKITVKSYDPKFLLDSSKYFIERQKNANDDKENQIDLEF